MEDMSFVTKGDAAEKLKHERLDFVGGERTACVHVLFEVFVHVFKDEHELVFGVDDVLEGDDVVVLEFFHEGDFADRGGGCAFFRVEVDFFEGDGAAARPLFAFEDGGICPGGHVRWKE
jgi:hypothetical protein